MRWLALLLLAGCSSPSFWAGASAADLTPDHPVPLGGYGARRGKPMTGVHDRIFAKALWLETKERKVCLVTTDLIGSTDEIRQEVLRRLPEKCDLILAASHNHSGPGALTKSPLWQLAMGKFDPRLWESYAAILTDLVVRASTSKKPASVAFAKGEAPELQRNRRAKHYEGEPPGDPEVFVMKVAGAVLTNFAAHGTVLGGENFLVSGDWPGAFQRALEKKLGGTALYTNGAEGDLSPRAPGGKDEFEKCESIGEALAAKVAGLATGNPDKAPRLRYVEERVKLPKATVPFVPGESVVGLLVIGEAAFLCVPGEMCVELGLELKRRFRARGFKEVAILGLANDHLGYFLTREQYGKGGYERDVSFYGPGMGEFLLESFDRLSAKVGPS